MDNYLAEGWGIASNITIGAFRAPRSNFIASAEQAFLDELAEELGKDPIDFRLELLERARTNPVGSTNDYEPERYAGVLKLVREKAGWDNPVWHCHQSRCSRQHGRGSYCGRNWQCLLRRNAF